MFKFKQLLLEWSKNDPIPEVTQKKDHLCVVMIGTPGAGKGFFINNFLVPRNKALVPFSSDDIRKTLAHGDDNVLPTDPQISGKDSALLKRRMQHYFQSGNSFIYDFTGNNEQWVAHAVPELRKLGYTIIFIHLLVPLQKALKQNALRPRHTPESFLKYSYKVTQKMMGVYEALRPDSYYIVTNTDGKYKFYKYKKGKLYKRKNDHYVLLPNT